MAYLYRTTLDVIENTPWDDVLLMAEAVDAIENPPEKPGMKGR